MRWINRYMYKRSRKRALRKIREGFAFWGIFAIDLTDDQLERRILDTSHMFGGICLTADEAMERLRKMLI